MFKLFIGLAMAWTVLLALALSFAARLVAHHWFSALWLSAVLFGAPVAWRWLAQYKLTAGVAARLDSAEGRLGAKLMLHLEAGKTALLCFLMSVLAAVKDWLGSSVHAALGLTPDDLDPLKDSALLHGLFSDAVAIKAIAAVTLASILLTIRGHLFAARLVPTAPAAPPAPPAPAPASPAA